MTFCKTETPLIVSKRSGFPCFALGRLRIRAQLYSGAPFGSEMRARRVRERRATTTEPKRAVGGSLNQGF